MPDWARQLADVLARQHCVLVTLHLMVGSSPRESGCRMIVSRSAIHGSIGGGQLEYQATLEARNLLGEGDTPLQLHRDYALGPALNQCCGGTVTLLFERFRTGSVPEWLTTLNALQAAQKPVVLATAVDRPEPFKALITLEAGDRPGAPTAVSAEGRKMLERGTLNGIETAGDDADPWWLEIVGSRAQPLLLFGAGHVGKAVARLLRDLPFEVTWVDGRPGVFPERPGSNIRLIESDDVAAAVENAPANSIFVVMTHSHELDEDICYQVLSCGNFAWLGLIGSVTKRRRFVQRLAQRGIDESALNRLVCPLGLEGIQGKQPATIALSLAAQLMHRETFQPEVRT